MSSKRKSKPSPEEGSSRRSKRLASTSTSAAKSENVGLPSTPKEKSRVTKRNVEGEEGQQLGEYEDARFLGEPVPDEEARRRWPHRYRNDSDLKDSEEVIQARCHYVQAEVDGQVFLLEDDAYVKGDSEEKNFIGKIIEIFKAVDGSQNFTAQWYYRANDTVIQTCGHLIDDKCVFFSEVKNDNPLECLVKKIRIVLLPPRAEPDVKQDVRATCDFYYDKMYLLPYTSFVSLADGEADSSDSGSTVSSAPDAAVAGPSEVKSGSEKTLLDLYSGCGAMSTGICLGANSYAIKLVTKWAVDVNHYACESLRRNHPETQVRHEAAENFLSLIKEWEQLCTSILSSEVNSLAGEQNLNGLKDNNDDGGEAIEDESEVYEVKEILDICYGDPNNRGNPALHFKIRWEGYGPEEDTWEPIEGLSACQEKLKEYVSRGFKSRILPLPGTVDVICGGPPCQGMSGFNRFRDKDQPLNDPRNKQLAVFMDIVEYLKPKFVLMENVVDIVRFAGGFLGRYALGKLVSMGYQARMGLMAAGAYGLPQFRMRMFMWGAVSTERLPQYPLPTHNVVVRGNVPTEFESNAVSFDVGFEVNLKEKLFLSDAISDLPRVENSEERDEMPYISDAETDFQRFIRLRRNEIPGCLKLNSKKVGHKLYDHRPLCLNQDDYERVCHIPKKKGASFRDLPGVKVGADNKVYWDPHVERHTLTSGKPLVPNYAMTFVKGSSSKPFGRLWWDETVPTVVTRAEPHNQVIIHPEQDRVLTIRENARLQGFPDYYKLLGPIKERYKQVGNAVAVPVARALGYSLARAMRGLSGEEPVFTLPEDYPMTKDIAAPGIVML